MTQPSSNARIYELALVAVPSALTCAQLLVKFAAERWQLGGACQRELDEVATGLVDHAVNAAPRQPTPEYVHLESLSLITVRLVLTPRAVVAEVWDSGGEAPDPSPVSTAADHGCRLPRPGSRVLWCVVNLGLPEQRVMAQTAAGIPRRERLQGPARESVAMRDQEFLHRVLDGLRALDAEES